MIQQDNTMQHVANAAMTGGAGTSIVLWGLNVSELAVIVSSAVAVIGFAVQVIIQLRADKREREFYAKRMEILANDPQASRGAGQETRID